MTVVVHDGGLLVRPSTLGIYSLLVEFWCAYFKSNQTEHGRFKLKYQVSGIVSLLIHFDVILKVRNRDDQLLCFIISLRRHEAQAMESLHFYDSKPL